MLATTKNKVAFGAVLAAALCIAAIIAVCVRDADAGNGVAFPTNEKGMTYGSLYDAQVTDSEPPDLVRAIASNGETGYFYYDEYQEIVGQDAALSAEEVAQREAAKHERIAESFKQMAAAYFGADMLSGTRLAQYFAGMAREGGTEDALASLNADVSGAVQANLTDSGDAIVPGGTSDDALSHVKSALVESEIALLAEAAAHGGAIDGAILASPDGLFADRENVSSLRVDPRADHVRQQVESRGVDSLMGEEAFAALYDAAAQTAKVSLTVYASDGETVVGEILIDVL